MYTIVDKGEMGMYTIVDKGEIGPYTKMPLEFPLYKWTVSTLITIYIDMDIKF